MKQRILLLLFLGVAACSQGAKKTVDDRVAQYGGGVQKRLAPAFTAAAIPYPPAKICLICLKQEGLLQLHAAGTNGQFRFIKSYPILAASGGPGPKLREGDRQVPEGLYRLESLNPNSAFHLALRLNYPNEFDREKAKLDGRKNPGSDIMIHGNAVSIGCLAMGDPAAEELFVLAARTGLRNVQVILCPVDLRRKPAPKPDSLTPPWVPQLYQQIRAELIPYEAEPAARPGGG